MPTIYSIKPQFQALLRPCVQFLARQGVTANQVTLFTTLLSIALGVLLVFFYQEKNIFFVVPIFLFIRMALNAIDGILAKEHDMKTELGAVLNELTDVISDAALYLPFALVEGFSSISIVLFTMLASLTEMAGVVAQNLRGVRRYDGPMGKSDRAFVFGVLALLIALNVPYAVWINYFIWVLNFLLVMTTYNRSIRPLREAK